MTLSLNAAFGIFAANLPSYLPGDHAYERWNYLWNFENQWSFPGSLVPTPGRSTGDYEHCQSWCADPQNGNPWQYIDGGPNSMCASPNGSYTGFKGCRGCDQCMGLPGYVPGLDRSGGSCYSQCYEGFMQNQSWHGATPAPTPPCTATCTDKSGNNNAIHAQ